MEKYKTIIGFINNLKFLENCDEDNNYTKELLSELQLILKEREEMLEFIKKYYKFLNLDDQVVAEQLIKEVE